ncbi:uncharacterized protein A4U43_C01F27610 [Asparagus officinalis]|nr:uncharacterized protein A4U43_C01F27610 [Asparagus officinalis]
MWVTCGKGIGVEGVFAFDEVGIGWMLLMGSRMDVGWVCGQVGCMLRLFGFARVVGIGLAGRQFWGEWALDLLIVIGCLSGGGNWESGGY